MKKASPHSVEAEQSLIGGILLNNDALPSVLEILRGEEFYRAAHRMLFSVMLELDVCGWLVVDGHGQGDRAEVAFEGILECTGVGQLNVRYAKDALSW